MRAAVSARTALHREWGGIQSRMARMGEVFLVVRILDRPYPTLRCLGSPLSARACLAMTLRTSRLIVHSVGAKRMLKLLGRALEVGEIATAGNSQCGSCGARHTSLLESSQ